MLISIRSFCTYAFLGPFFEACVLECSSARNRDHIRVSRPHPMLDCKCEIFHGYVSMLIFVVSERSRLGILHFSSNRKRIAGDTSSFALVVFVSYVRHYILSSLVFSHSLQSARCTFRATDCGIRPIKYNL